MIFLIRYSGICDTLVRIIKILKSFHKQMKGQKVINSYGHEDVCE
jgi:hypothetical protein